MNYKPDFESEDEKDEFLKTRIESLNLSRNIENTLTTQNIRTVRGLLNKQEKELHKQLHFNKSDIDLVLKKLNILELEIKLNNEKRILNREKYTNKANIYNEPETEILKKIYLKPDGKEDIISIFASRFGLENKEDLCGPSRKQEVVFARDILIYCLREYADRSFPSIGRFLGGRDHTTIIHAYRKIKDYISKNPKLEIELRELINKVKEIKKEEVEKQSSKEFLDVLIFDTPEFEIKKIPERNKNILELFNQKNRVVDISALNNISHQRIFQIIKQTIRQSIINDYLSSGKELNNSILEEEENKFYNNIKLARRPVKKVRVIREPKWSYKYTTCKNCNSTEFKHYRNGLCEICGNKSVYGDERENIINKHSNTCDLCGIERKEAQEEYGRDFYISRKDNSVLCRECFLNKTGKDLGLNTKNRWKKFYKNY